MKKSICIIISLFICNITYCFNNGLSRSAFGIQSPELHDMQPITDAGRATFYQHSTLDGQPPVAAIGEIYYSPQNQSHTNQTSTATQLPVDAQKVEKAPGNSNFIKDDSALPAKVNQSALKNQQNTALKLHFDNESKVAIAKPTIAIHIDEPKPIIIYNAQGVKISEHLINDDGSEHNTVYESNGDVITTILDSSKIKQQVIIKKPDGSSITKYYNAQGKQEAIETINRDGSRLHTFNNSAGIITNSEIYNKNNEQESSLSVSIDDYETVNTTIHNHDDSVITSSRDVHGTTTKIKQDPHGRMMYKLINYRDGSKDYTWYNNGNIQQKRIATANNLHETYITYFENSTQTIMYTQGIMIEKLLEYKNGTTIKTTYEQDEDGNERITSQTTTKPNKSSEFLMYENGILVKRIVT